VVVGDLDIERVASCPSEADPPLVIHSNAVLPFFIIASAITRRRGADEAAGRHLVTGNAPSRNGPPPSAVASRVLHRVPFYETDAMGVVHHSNFVRYLELARIAWLSEHDRPYTEYVAQGLHFATTRVEVDYLLPVRFDDEIDVCTWAERVGGASLRMAYALRVGGELVATAVTEHAAVDTGGRVRRIPPERRAALRALVAS
jgi:acyl-CoA thioester hydrolase